MLWTLFALAYLLFNVVGILVFRKLLSPKIANSLLVWLFSISLSLSLSFPMALLAISFYIKSVHP
jgi:hypothetical protein